MDSLKNISQFNTGSTIANGMALSESAIISYKTAIDGLSLSQAQAALSSTALTDAQKEQILVSAGLLQSTQAITLEEVKQMASSASLSSQKKEEILTTLQGAYSENEWNMERLEAIAASGSEAGAIAQSILAKKAENAENIKGVASSKALTVSLWEQLKARLALLAANPVAWIAGIAAVSVGLIALQKKLTKSLDECTEELSNFNSEVENAQSEADSLQTEWETCQKRLIELQKLADNGTISIIEQEEYERLLKTNDELERNIRIQKEKAQLSAIDAVNSADETLNKTVESKYVTVNAQDSQGVEVTQTAWITPKEELNASIEEYKRLQTEIDRLKVSYDKGNISAEDYNAQLTDLTNQQTDARNRASEMSDILEKCEQAYENLDNTGAELTTTQTANYNSVKQANAAYNDFLGTINGVDSAFENLDTTEKAQSLKNKYAAKKVSLPNGQGTYTVEDKEISDWIDTLPDDDLTVLASINFSGEQTKDSMQEALDYAKNNVDGNIDETDILSFSEAWSNLKSSTDDATKGLADNLTELAEKGQLTVEALSEADTTDFFKNAGISAEEATRQINALVSASTQLQSMSTQISKMSDMLADKKNGTVASADDLASFDVEVRGLESWEEFERVMGSSTSTMEECQNAVNALANEWINSNNFLANLDETNKDYYITQLQNMNISNARAIVESQLAQKTAELTAQEAFATATGKDLANATVAEIVQFGNLSNQSTNTKIQIAQLTLEQLRNNANSITTATSCSNLIALAGQAGATATQIGKLAKLYALLNQIQSGNFSGVYNGPGGTSISSVLASIDAIIAEINSTKITPPPNITTAGTNTAGTNGTNGTSTNTTPTPTNTGVAKQEFSKDYDWMESKLKYLERLAKKCIDNVLNYIGYKTKEKKVKNALESIGREMKQNLHMISVYKAQAKKVKLDKKYVDLIKGGQKINLSTIKDEGLSKKIDAYQDWYDKIIKCKEANEELRDSIVQVTEAFANSFTEKAESKIERYEQRIKLSKAIVDNTFYSAKKNKQLNKQRKYIDKTVTANKDAYNTTNSFYKSYGKKITSQKAPKQKKQKKTFNSLMKSVKSYQKSGSVIPISKLNAIYKYCQDINNFTWYRNCETYNALVLARQAAKDTYDLSVQESKKDKNQLGLERMQNISDASEKKYYNRYEAIGKSLDNRASLIEAKGYSLTDTYYKEKINLDKKELKNYNNRRDALIKELSTGNIKEGTDEWYEALELIESTTDAAEQLEVTIQEDIKALQELNDTNFERLLSRIDDLNSELQFYTDIMSNFNLTDDNGLNDFGKATQSLLYAQALVAKENAQKAYQYASEIDPTESLDASERHDKFLEEARSYNKDYFNYLNGVIDLEEQRFQALNDNINQTIKKYKELLSTESDEYSYQKQMKEKAESLSKLQKQMASISGDASEETRAKIQQLQVSIKDTQDDIEETQYNRFVSDVEQLLDDLSDDFSTYMDEFFTKLRDYDSEERNAFFEKINQSGSPTEDVLNKISQSIGIGFGNLNLKDIFDSDIQKGIGTSVQNIEKDMDVLLKKADTDSSIKNGTFDDSQTSVKKQKVENSKNTISKNQETIKKLKAENKQHKETKKYLIDAISNENKSYNEKKKYYEKRIKKSSGSEKKMLELELSDITEFHEKVIKQLNSLLKETTSKISKNNKRINELKAPSETIKKLKEENKQQKETKEYLTDAINSENTSYEKKKERYEKLIKKSSGSEKKMLELELSDITASHEEVIKRLNSLLKKTNSTISKNNKRINELKASLKASIEGNLDNLDSLALDLKDDELIQYILKMRGIDGSLSEVYKRLKSESASASDKEKKSIYDFLSEHMTSATKDASKYKSSLNQALAKEYGIVLSADNRKELKKLLDLKSEADVLKRFKKLKISGFKTGLQNSLYNQIAWTQENGKEIIYRAKDGAMLTALGKGDKVFTSEMSDNLWNLAQMNPANMNFKYLNNIPLPTHQSKNQTLNIEIGDIVLPDVTNPDQFANSLKNVVKNNTSVQKQLKDLTIGSLSSKSNSLNIRKY